MGEGRVYTKLLEAPDIIKKSMKKEREIEAAESVWSSIPSRTYSFWDTLSVTGASGLDDAVNRTCGVSVFGYARTDQTFCLIFPPRRTGAFTRQKVGGTNQMLI
jgi:hypothetical protein